MDKDLENVKVACKCDRCDEYHLESEMEVVYFKIKKGKNCPLNARQEVVSNSEFEKKGFVRERVREEKILEPVVQEEIPNKPKKTVIPDSILRTMVPPTDERFKTMGAVEKRVA